jgi:transcriptional regulator with XRE-family HTH domain
MLSIAISPIYIRLKEARMIFGVSQKKLGIMIGMDEFSASSRMNQYETGKHIPDFLTLTRIAKILLVPVAYFYAVDDDLAGLLFLYEKYNSKAKERLLKFCKKLSKFKQKITAKILS